MEANSTYIKTKTGEVTIATVNTGEGRYIVKSWHKITDGKIRRARMDKR